MSIRRILFVCLGNICRSPMAEGIFQHVITEKGLMQSFELDSAGTGAYHIGENPDHRAIQICSKKGVILTHKARQVKIEDFHYFDYILAMDRDNYQKLGQISSHNGLYLFRDFDPEARRDKNVPDPYYGGLDGFEEVYQMLHRSAHGFLDHVLKEKS